MYYERIIDQYLNEWAARPIHKPVLLRGARQVGKSTAVRHLGEQFKYFVEINLEKQADYKALLQQNLDVKRIVPQMAAMHGTPIIPGETLLFIDEVQDCQEAYSGKMRTCLTALSALSSTYKIEKIQTNNLPKIEKIQGNNKKSSLLILKM